MESTFGAESMSMLMPQTSHLEHLRLVKTDCFSKRTWDGHREFGVSPPQTTQFANWATGSSVTRENLHSLICLESPRIQQEGADVQEECRRQV